MATTTAAPPAAEDGTSGTNVQEAGVDEPDVVKTAGSRIFAIGGGRLHAVHPDGREGYQDGYPDILFRKKTTGRLRMWMMRGPNRVPPPGDVVVPRIIEPSDLHWKAVAR